MFAVGLKQDGIMDRAVLEPGGVLADLELSTGKQGARCPTCQKQLPLAPPRVTSHIMDPRQMR